MCTLGVKRKFLLYRIPRLSNFVANDVKYSTIRLQSMRMPVFASKRNLVQLYIAKQFFTAEHFFNLNPSADPLDLTKLGQCCYEVTVSDGDGVV